MEHKTVFLLDHGPEFADSSRQSFDLDQRAIQPQISIVKTNWTCATEAVLEYARIVYDIYPRKDRLVALISSDDNPKTLNSWQHSDQGYNELLRSLLTAGRPKTKANPQDSLGLKGLQLAVSVLGKPSPNQSELANYPTNQGRIIYITNLRNNDDAKLLSRKLSKLLQDHNILCEVNKKRQVLLPIAKCQFVILHTYPVTSQSDIRDRNYVVNDTLSVDVRITKSGKYLAECLLQLALQNYKLASTTITGIPMKEEQNANSSANYDVEMLHEGSAQELMDKLGPVEMAVSQSNIPTVRLRWCTPKVTPTDQPCVGAFRISPVDVNSRPSTCLTNFVMAGRTVMLEQASGTSKTGKTVAKGPTYSHMLSAHNGFIYLYVLDSTRSPLDDPPAITEGIGGRLPDYRINNFIDVIKATRLKSSHTKGVTDTKSLSNNAKILEKLTRVFPLTTGESLIFNLPNLLEPILSLTKKESILETELIQCRNLLCKLVDMETQKEPLPTPHVASKAKSCKREDQYRLLWSEIGGLLESHSSSSSNHKEIYQYYMTCKRPNDSDPVDSPANKRARLQTNSLPETPDSESKQPIRSSKEAKPLLSLANFDSSSNKTVYDIWNSHLASLFAVKHEEFAGRRNSVGSKAILYANLLDKLSAESMGGEAGGPNGGNPGDIKEQLRASGGGKEGRHTPDSVRGMRGGDGGRHTPDIGRNNRGNDMGGRVTPDSGGRGRESFKRSLANKDRY